MYTSELEALLKNNFGFDTFRPLQQEIIDHVVQKKDTFVLMPTGGGKSLCYQLPALYFKGLTIVISPLIALMKDQVDALKLNGVAAERINSSMTAYEIQAVMQKARQGELKLLYIAPERLAQEPFRQFLSQLKLSLIAIDEAHCISEWGHDFRPEYRNLSELRNLFPGVPIVALTATATPKVQQDILNQLQLKDARTYLGSFNRPNLKFTVLQKKGISEKLEYFLEKYKGESVIIYCFSRKDTENLAAQLQHFGYKAAAYHAGLKPEERKNTQEQFIRDEIQIITATIAFGMGIDKSNIRLVVHYSFPKSIEGYYQEVGRAGRDGLPSECVTFYGFQDSFSHRFFINQIADPKLRQSAEQKLQQVMNYCSGNGCRRRYLLGYFGEKPSEGNCQNCDHCTGYPDTLVFQETSAGRSQRSQISSAKKTDLPFHQDLFEALRALRKQLADQNGVPPYVIFSDATLQEMAYYLPDNEERFGSIQGVGGQKMEQFANVFLKEIRQFIERTNHRPLDIPDRWTRRRKAIREGESPRYFLTKKLIDEKKPLAEIAKAQGVKPGTIIQHLERLLQSGIEMDFDYLKPSSDRMEVMRWAFQKCGDERLKPVFEFLQEKYLYDELRLARMVLKREKKEKMISCP